MRTALASFNASEIAYVALACVFGAFLTGALGLGGVIILPALLLTKDVNARTGVASLFVAFTPAMALRVVILRRTLPRDGFPWRAGTVTGIGAAGGSALAATALLERTPRNTMMIVVGAVAALAGTKDVVDACLIVFNRRRRARERRTAEDEVVVVETKGESVTTRDDATWAASDVMENELWAPSNTELLVLFIFGVLVGVLSVLTGTGGPIIFLPLAAIWKGSKVHRKVLLAVSAVQSVFLGVAAIISEVAIEQYPDVGLVLLIAPCAILGVFVGVGVLRYASREALMFFMGVVLLGVGAFTIQQGSS